MPSTLAPDLDVTSLRAMDPEGASAWAARILDGLGPAESARRLVSAGTTAGRPAVIALVAEGRRRLDEDAAWQDVVDAGANVLADLYEESERDGADVSPEGPLRLRILRVLAADPLRSTAVARAVSAPGPLVSRTLKTLESDGLVASEKLEVDRRGRLYRLTPRGEAAQARWGARSAPRPPTDPISDDDRVREAVAHAIASALDLRRVSNRLPEAQSILVSAVREADGLPDKEPWLRAVVELAITQRQSRAWRGHAESLKKLTAVGTGAEPVYAAVSTPAMAFSLYERARRGGRPSGALFADLSAAAILFGELSAHRRATADRLAVRHGWALFALAELLRQQTAFGAALQLASSSGERFAREGDAYGAANSLLLAGYCLRVRGRFDPAISVLDAAVARGADLGFERLRINAMVQLGETCRAAGQVDRAKELLEEAAARSTSPQMRTAHAFASCHLGAVAYMTDDHAIAERRFTEAEHIFSETQDRSGLGLALRRHAALKRKTIRKKQQVEKLIAILSRARQRYAAAESPAGVAACVVERGRFELAAGRSLAKEARDMDALLQSDGAMLALDPWLPALLTELAKDAVVSDVAGAKRLADHGTELMKAAERATAAEHHDWSWVMGEVHLGDEYLKAQVDYDRADEMAGEPRRHTGLVDESLLASATAS